MTRTDWLRNNLVVARAWGRLLGVCDVLAVAVPYELTYVGADIDRVAEVLGIGVLSVGANNSLCPWPRVIQLLAAHGVTALFCSPTRAIRLAQIAKECGIDPEKDLGVRTIISVGEPCSSAKRALVAKLWRAQVYNHYGMTESMAVAVPCVAGAQHLCEERLYAELVEPTTGTAVGRDEEGELVLTTLDVEGLPLIRYRTGDVVVLDSQPCTCGNPNTVLRQLDRASKLPGNGPVRRALRALDEVMLSAVGFEPYYWVKEGKHHITVTCAPEDNRGSEWQRARTVRKLQERLEKRFQVRFEMDVISRKECLERVDSSSKPGVTGAREKQ